MGCGFVFNNPLKQASENENTRCEKPALCGGVWGCTCMRKQNESIIQTMITGNKFIIMCIKRFRFCRQQ